MTTRIRDHVRSNVVGYIALFAFGIGGVAYAGDGPLAGQNTVGSDDIIGNEVNSGDIANGRIFNVDLADDAIQSGKVKDNTLTGDDIQENTLNGVDADKLAGSTSEDYQARWFLLNEQGQIEAQSGGFTVADAYQTNANAYINTGEDLTGNGMTATIAIQNQVNVDGLDDDAEPDFDGEVSITQCGIPSVVVCAPAGTNNANHLVVSPRNSDGTATTATTRKRVYVVVTDDRDALMPAN